MSLRARQTRAFTLLEVVVALAIMGVSIVAILEVNAQAVNSHVYAKKLTIATLLARSKMIDLEQDLYEKPLSTDDEEDSGDFSKEGWSSYKWRSKIVVPKTNGLTPEQLFGALFNLPLADTADGPGLISEMFPKDKSKPSGGGTAALPGMAAAGAAGGSSLLSALGPLAPMAGQQFTSMVDTLQKAVREVHLTVSWKEGKTTESIDLVTHVVSMGPGSDRNGGATGATSAPGGQTGQNSYVRLDNGAPVANPRQGPNGTLVDPTDGFPVVLPAQYQAARGAGAMIPPAGLR